MWGSAVHGFDWTEEAVATLRALWAEGLSAVKIGDAMGITKNAVIGKVHRLDLTARPSPIRPRDPNAPKPPKVERAKPAGKVTLPRPRCTAPVDPYVERAPRIPRAPRVLAPRHGLVIECCWPIGEPREAGFRFCCEPSAAGRPYCEAHCAVGYVTVRVEDRRAA